MLTIYKDRLYIKEAVVCVYLILQTLHIEVFELNVYSELNTEVILDLYLCSEF